MRIFISALFVCVLVLAGIFLWMERIQQETVLRDEVTQLQKIVLLQSSCEEVGGTWNACGSACREHPEDACIQVCVEYCECRTDEQCPEGFVCREFVDGVGVCQSE